MTKQKAMQILTEYNIWRRGVEPHHEAGAKIDWSPTEIGEAIDKAINIMKEAE